MNDDKPINDEELIRQDERCKIANQLAKKDWYGEKMTPNQRLQTLDWIRRGMVHKSRTLTQKGIKK